MEMSVTDFFPSLDQNEFVEGERGCRWESVAEITGTSSYVITRLGSITPR